MKKSTLYFSLMSLVICRTAYCEFNSDEISQLMGCYQSELSSKSGPEKYQFAIDWPSEPHVNAGKDSMYKLFIDKERFETALASGVKNPHLIFDIDEPGYFQGMKNAFQLMSTLIGKEN